MAYRNPLFINYIRPSCSPYQDSYGNSSSSGPFCYPTAAEANRPVSSLKTQMLPPSSNTWQFPSSSKGKTYAVVTLDVSPSECPIGSKTAPQASQLAVFFVGHCFVQGDSDAMEAVVSGNRLLVSQGPDCGSLTTSFNVTLGTCSSFGIFAEVTSDLPSFVAAKFSEPPVIGNAIVSADKSTLDFATFVQQNICLSAYSFSCNNGNLIQSYYRNDNCTSLQGQVLLGPFLGEMSNQCLSTVEAVPPSSPSASSSKGDPINYTALAIALPIIVGSAVIAFLIYYYRNGACGRKTASAQAVPSTDIELTGASKL
jgi:hypothetical protein